MKFITNILNRAGSILLTLVVSPFVLVAQDVHTEKPKQLPAAILRKYDADRDGILSEEEKSAWKADVQRGRQEAQARRLEKYDSNRDGKLDKSEKAAASAGTNSKRGVDSRKQPSSEDDHSLEAGSTHRREEK